jgi:hypothetical protein
LPWLPPDREDVAGRGYGKQNPTKNVISDQDTNPVNYSYRESLTPAQQEAYDFALAGEQDPYAERDPNKPSCYELAQSALPWTGQAPEPKPYQQFSAQFSEPAAAMESLHAFTVFDDPEVRTLDMEYDICMGNSGFDLGSGGEYAPGEVNPWTAFTMAQHTKADGSLGESWVKGDGLTHDSWPMDEQSMLGTAGEIRIALADYDCRAQTDYVDRFKAAYLRLEAQFVDEHKSQLEDMKTFVEEHP